MKARRLLSPPSSLEPLEARIAPASIDAGSATVPTGDIAFDAGDTFSVTLLADNPAPPPAFASGQLQVTGSVSLNGAALDLTVLNDAGESDFIVIDNDEFDSIQGIFAGLPQSSVFQAGGSFFRINYIGGDGNDVEVRALVTDLRIVDNGRTATFTDVDGDAVTIKTSAGQWTPDMFELIPAGFVGGFALKTIDLGGAAGFNGVKISIAANRQDAGNGAVNIEAFDAAGINLRKFTQDGALGFILAGSGSGSTPAIKKLTVQSLGSLGTIGIPQNGAFLASELNGGLGKLIVTSDIRDASLRVSGSAGAVSVRGSVINSQLHADFDFNSVTITGDLLGAAAGGSVLSAFGQKTAPSNGSDIAFKKISVGGRIENALILAGYNELREAVNADASIGTLKVGTDWIASTVHAGTVAGDDGFDGTADDRTAAGDGVRDRIDVFARIAKIKIAGQAYGTLESSDAFGIVAEEIRKAQIGKTRLPFFQGPFGDLVYAAVTGPGATGELSDFAIFEVLAPAVALAF